MQLAQVFCCFFFQAEDGIRDVAVTGVKTCALPISCVYRTGQRFGAGHVIDVLLGRATERVSQLGHDRLSTFGIGADRDERQWRAVFRQLVALGYLWADGEAFGALKLTQTARQVLKGETSVMLREQAARPARVKRGKQTVAKVAIGAAAPDSALLQ